MINLKNLSFAELKEQMAAQNEPAFRARQVFKWIYQKRLDSFDGMDNIPKTSRAKFGESFGITKLPVTAVLESARRDAVKFGFSVDGGAVIESVLLYDDDRRTACISSQLGCGLGCVFCATGKTGLVRNLTQAEIIGQLIGMNDYLSSKQDKPVTNIVFMGMGEALSNFDTFRGAIDIIMSEDAFCIGGRRITVSTAGVVPSIERLMQENLTIGLAISLNAYSDEKRSAIMPINRKYPIAQLVDAARRYFEKTGRRVTFEYVLVEGENDTREAADALERLLKNLPCKINLIPINPGGGEREFKAPSEAAVNAFCEELFRRGMTATLRKSRGRDISGACGQLGARFNAASGAEDTRSEMRR